MVRSFRRWAKSTSNRTFVLYPILVVLFEFALHGRGLRIEPWGIPLLIWGYLQYRLCGTYRTRLGGGGPGLSNPPERIVDSGIYALVRNPMYLGHMIFLAGLAMVTRSPLALVAVAVHVPWFSRRVRRDEVRLRSEFGARYDEYCAQVPRWIPGRATPSRGVHGHPVKSAR
jgi:protein-S-isoprenylcysteine O-methyltransferase Ste14